MLLKEGNFVDRKLGVTQDYDRSNYDSARAKRTYKEKAFGDSAVITDPTTGEILHKSQTAAQNKYHMKNNDGENISKKWANHSTEIDHINSLKSIHDKTKHNSFLSDDDIQEIANCDANLRVMPKSLNASKGEKSDLEVIFDADNGLSLKGRANLAGEKIKSDVVLTGKFTHRTAENIVGLATDSAKESVANHGMEFVRYGVDHIIDIACRNENLQDAVADVGVFTIKTVGKDVAKDVADAALVNNALYQSLKGRTNLAGEKIKSDVALTGKFTHRTAENIVGLATDSAKESVANHGKEFVRYGVDHIIDIACRNENLQDAVVDVGVFTIKTVGKDVAKDVADAALVNNALYQSLKNSGALGELIQVGTMVAESASRLIDGEITAEEFMLEIGDKGATMVAQMVAGEVGAFVGEIIGITTGGFLGAGVGSVIGHAIGTMIATVACNAVIAIRTNIIANFKSLNDYKLQEKAIHKLELEAIAEMEYQRQRFREIVESEYKKWDENIEAGFNQIMRSACQEVYDLQGITEGLDRILFVFGKSVMFKNLDEYEAQLDMPLKLSF